MMIYYLETRAVSLYVRTQRKAMNTTGKQDYYHDLITLCYKLSKLLTLFNIV